MPAPFIGGTFVAAVERMGEAVGEVKRSYPMTAWQAHCPGASEAVPQNKHFGAERVLLDNGTIGGTPMWIEKEQLAPDPSTKPTPCAVSRRDLVRGALAAVLTVALAACRRASRTDSRTGRARGAQPTRSKQTKARQTEARQVDARRAVPPSRGSRAGNDRSRRGNPESQ